tara:strand:+ start:89 stop:2152 length:2064 start_codon:yes stop_codon:yes gene_type:complete
MNNLTSKSSGIFTFKSALINVINFCFLFFFFIAPIQSEEQSHEPNLSAKKNYEDLSYKNNSNSFMQAEHLFHIGKFIDAKPHYHKHLLDNSGGKIKQNVFFRLGLIDQNLKSFATALWYYQMLLDFQPNSLLVNEVKYNMAICNFELGNFDAAEKLFNNIIKQSVDKKQKWKALYYLSKLDAQKLSFEDAIQKLTRIYLNANDKKMREYAIKLAEKMIDEKFSEKNLSSLIQIYKTDFPADLLLLKKISIYREQGKAVLYKSVLEEFLTKFPQHKKSEEFIRDLESIKKGSDVNNIEVGILLPLTGKLAATGQQVLQGIQLAYSLLPEGYRSKIFLKVRDSSDSVSIEEALSSLARNPKTVGVLGPLLSSEIKRSSVIADSFKLPIFSPTASSADLVDVSPYIFRNALTRKIQARYLAEYSINKLKLRRFVILYPLESFGEELKNEFLRSVELLGGEVVSMASYDRAQNDFKVQILELGGVADDDLDRITRKQLSQNEALEDFSDPTVLSRPKVDRAHWSEDKIENLKVSLELGYDAIFIPGVYDKVGLIIPQLAFYNIENIALLGTNGWNSPELIKMGGKFLKSIYFVDGFYSDSHEMRVEKFVQQFQINYGESPSHLSAQAYDAAGIVFQTIISGGDNRLKLRDKLLKVKNYPGVTGKTDIMKSGDSEKDIFALTVRRKKIVEEN